MTNEQQIKDLFRKNSVQPLAPIDADLILKNKKATLIAVYKLNKKYTWLTAAAICLLFAAKKTGISLSILHCYIIMIALPAVLVTGISAGAVYTARTQPLPLAPVAALTEAITTVPSAAPAVPCGIQIQKFRHDELSSGAASIIEKTMFSELSRLKGKGFAQYDGASTQTDTLTGSVIHTGDDYIISMKLVDRNAKVVFFRQATLKNESEIADFSRSIAASVIQR